MNDPDLFYDELPSKSAEKVVLELMLKAKDVETADGALKFSQAACNVANANAVMKQLAKEDDAQYHQGTLLLTKDDNFDPGICAGERLFCALVPVERKREFLGSRLREQLRFCTDKILFYAEDTG